MERVEEKSGRFEALDEVREMVGRTGVTMNSIPFEIEGIREVRGRERVIVRRLLNPISTNDRDYLMDPLLPETVLRRIKQGEWILEPVRKEDF